MITNVESLVVVKRKDRYQHNMPVTLPTSELDFYLTDRHPDPGLGDAEPYNESGILPAPVDNDPRQVIVHETASSTDAVTAEYRELRKERKALLDEYHSDLKRYWAILMAMPKIDKIFYKPVQKLVWLPQKRVRMHDGFRIVMRKVTLTARQIPTTETKVIRSYDHGRPILKRVKYTTLKWVTPFVWRPERRAKYRYVTVRTAGMYPRRVRVKTVVKVRDWTSIRRRYSAYKQGLVDNLRPRLSSLTERFDALRKKVHQRPPRLMASWTTHGFVRPYQPGETLDTKPYRVNGVRHRATSVAFRRTAWDFVPAADRWRTRHGAFIFYSPGYGPIADQTEYPPDVTPAQVDWFEREHSLPMMGEELRMNRLKRAQGDYRFIERPSLERHAMLAYSTIKSLTKARDYQFQWFRSLVELKDMKQSVNTLKQISKTGAGFLTWVAHIQNAPILERRKIGIVMERCSKRFGATVRLLAASYLAYKFAVEPTMADVDTVINMTSDWLFEIRRALSSVLTDPNSYLNTYHARAKYGDNVRELKLGRDASLLAGDRLIEVNLPCTVRWPSFIWRELGSCPSFPDADAFTCAIDGPNHVEEDGWYNFPAVSRPIRVTADTGVFEQPLTVSGISHHSWWGTNPPSSSGPFWHQLYGDPEPSLSIEEIEDWIMRCTFQNSPVVERYPVYMSTWTKGVVFGEYRLDDLLSLLTLPGSSSPDLKSLMTSVYVGASDLLSRIDIVKNAWELTPLSFVYDWFTDSSLLVTTLANMARTNWAIYSQVPEPLNGIWESRRTELLAGTGQYQFAGCECLEYIGSSRIDTTSHSDWSWAGFSPVLRPVVSHRRYRLRFQAVNDKIRLMRTGLYRARRGEQTGYSSIASYLPNVSVSITGGKILSLSALITSLFGGNGR